MTGEGFGDGAWTGAGLTTTAGADAGAGCSRRGSETATGGAWTTTFATGAGVGAAGAGLSTATGFVSVLPVIRMPVMTAETTIRATAAPPTSTTVCVRTGDR